MEITWNTDITPCNNATINWSNMINTNDTPSYSITFDPTKTWTAPITRSDLINTKEQKEEKKSMFNFNFGPIKNDKFKICAFGIAVKDSNGKYFAYNDGTTMDVSDFCFDSNGMLYMIPVSQKHLKEGDIILHQDKPMVVIHVHLGISPSIEAIDIASSEKKEILPVKSPFGFNFITKVVSIIDMDGSHPDEDNPFGNISPFFFLAGSDNNDFFKYMMLSKFMEKGKNEKDII